MQPSKLCKRRLAKEWKMLVKSPVQCVRAAPNPDNILEWHFIIHSLDDDRYRNGYYHGIILFPADYPYKPPSVKMTTESGRFAINTKLCLSITDFHPESWNPLWSVSSIMAAIVSFFVEDLSTHGSIRTSKHTKKVLAKKSLGTNCKTSPIFRTLFPDLVELYQAKLLVEPESKEEQEEDVVNISQELTDSQIGLYSLGFLGITIAIIVYLLIY